MWTEPYPLWGALRIRFRWLSVDGRQTDEKDRSLNVPVLTRSHTTASSLLLQSSCRSVCNIGAQNTLNKPTSIHRFHEQGISECPSRIHPLLVNNPTGLHKVQNQSLSVRIFLKISVCCTDSSPAFMDLISAAYESLHNLLSQVAKARSCIKPATHLAILFADRREFDRQRKSQAIFATDRMRTHLAIFSPIAAMWHFNLVPRLQAPLLSSILKNHVIKSPKLIGLLYWRFAAMCVKNRGNGHTRRLPANLIADI